MHKRAAMLKTHSRSPTAQRPYKGTKKQRTGSKIIIAKYRNILIFAAFVGLK
jgi:hypothetical protein